MRNLTSSLLLASLAASPAWAQGPQVTELPGMTPWDTTADGSIVVGESNSGQYFMWTAMGGATDIGGVGAGNGVGGAPNISADGTRIGGTDFNSMSGLHEMSIYDPNTMTWTHLGGIGGSSGSETSSGWGLSGDGRHLVGLGWVNAGEAHAVQWSEGGTVVDLGSTSPGDSSRANAVDEDGDVVVGWQDGNGRQAAVWHSGVQTLLTAPNGSALSEAGDVSADGEWVVGIGSSGTSNEAWRWSQSTGTQALGSLGLPGFPPAVGFGTATNADGSIVIGFDRPFGPPTSGEGWIWTEAGGLVSLDDFFAAQGLVVQNNLRFSLPLGISDDGRTFVGLGRSDVAFSIGWVVTLGDGPIPYCFGQACACGNDDGSAGCANSTGSGAVLSSSGSTSVGLDDLVLITSQVPSDKAGLYFFGPNQVDAPFGDGRRCVGGATRRFFPVLDSGASGNLTLGPGLVAQSVANFPPSHHLTAASTWNFQSWYRDPMGPCGTGFNLSNGLRVTFAP